MKKIIITLAIAALTVAFTTQAQAGPKPANQNAHKSVTANKINGNKVTAVKMMNSKPPVTNIHVNKISNYHLKFGTKSSFGYSYQGQHHNHWTVIRFDAH